jgi:hypothetical protein
MVLDLLWHVVRLTLILELTKERLVSSEKQEMTHQELLRWIVVCVLIAGINFRGRRRNLWEGGGTALKYLPSYDLRDMPIFLQLTLRRRSGGDHTNSSNINLIFMDMMCCDVGRMAQLHVRA